MFFFFCLSWSDYKLNCWKKFQFNGSKSVQNSKLAGIWYSVLPHFPCRKNAIFHFHPLYLDGVTIKTPKYRVWYFSFLSFNFIRHFHHFFSFLVLHFFFFFVHHPEWESFPCLGVCKPLFFVNWSSTFLAIWYGINILASESFLTKVYIVGMFLSQSNRKI